MWRGIAGLLAIMSVVIVLAAGLPGRRTLAVVMALALVTIGLTFAQGPTAFWRHSGIGAGRAGVTNVSPNLLRQLINERRHSLIWEAEGVESSIGIFNQSGYAFVVNGKTDGNSLEDAATQMGAAILGAVLHDDPKTGLVIGLGTGESAGWLAQMRNVERVDVVELEPAIDEMAQRCSDVNWDVLNNPRVRRIYNDGREFVLTTDQQYDVIISEPSNPYRAGVAALYTIEFYQAARQRLKPGGLFIQWLQAYEVDGLTVHTVLSTARSAFEHVEVWQTLAADLQLVCSAEPIQYSVDELRERIGSDVVRTALAQAWNVSDVEGFLGHFVANADWADAVERTPFMQRNTDDRTVLEYSFAKTVGGATGFATESLRADLQAAGYHRPPLPETAIDWNLVEIRRQQLNFLFDGQLSVALLPRSQDVALVEAWNKYQHTDFAGVVEQWPSEYREPNDPIQRLILARSYAELARDECLELLNATEESHPIDVAAVEAIYHWRAGRAAESVDALEQFFALLRESPWLIPRISETAFLRAVDAARADPGAARRLYPFVSRPFAAGRFEYLRLLTRARLAEVLGPQTLVEALADFEPHIPWAAEILESRAKAYAAVNHPLARRAERDWQWFQRHQISD
jgi:spermidine synthase